MNKLSLYLLVIFILLQGCQIKKEDKQPIKNVENTNKLDSLTYVEQLKKQEKAKDPFDIEVDLNNYQNLKQQIKKEQKSLKKRSDINQAKKIELAQAYMSEMLVDSIFIYWLGTKWDFNGYTEKPREGEVACGYFVSTTLRDLGIRLNRYKIAQKAASEIVSSLCDQQSITRLSSLDKLKEFLENVEEQEILIVGLDYHVGFLFKKDNKSYFAHSNYINRKGVEIELIENSTALKNTQVYVVGNFTKNKKVVGNWLN